MWGDDYKENSPYLTFWCQETLAVPQLWKRNVRWNEHRQEPKLSSEGGDKRVEILKHTMQTTQLHYLNVKYSSCENSKHAEH